MKIVAIITAGGSGKRLKAEKAKQYLPLVGRPVLVYSLQAFESCEIINEIIIVVPKNDVQFVRDELVGKTGINKVVKVIEGGAERQDSVRNGLSVVDSGCDLVVIHDGVRPLVTKAMIKSVVDAAQLHQAASVGVKAKDTIKETQDDDIVTRTVPRENLWLTQTPQAFQFAVIKKAYDKAYSDGYYGTDDASLTERLGIKVKMVAGSYENLKITTPEDIIMAEAFLRKKEEGEEGVRTGLGYDSHRLVEGRKLILGGIEIPFGKGLAGHSDADALIHAVCDALLGAAVLGDIGRHFPDSDSAYKDISSGILLRRVKEMIADKHFSIGNIDVSVIMERPKLAPYADKIVNNISEILNIPASRINIKAKTNEGMGFVGRNEGIAVFCVATLRERGE